MSRPQILATDLHYRYPDGMTALAGASFAIHHGERVAIVGANGAGKSTLLLHLSGVLQPSQGQVTIDDLPVTEKTFTTVRQRVGLVFQDPDDQLFMPTVLEDVTFGPLNLGVPPEESQRRARECLEQVGAWHLRDRPPHRLSAGEKRRVAIAAVLAMAPDVLVLDEPTTGLDPCGRRQLIQLLKGFPHTRIIASHDLDLVLELCPRTILLHAGKIAADRPTVELMRDDQLLQRTGLERPLSMQCCPICNNK